MSKPCEYLSDECPVVVELTIALESESRARQKALLELHQERHQSEQLIREQADAARGIVVDALEKAESRAADLEAKLKAVEAEKDKAIDRFRLADLSAREAQNTMLKLQADVEVSKAHHEAFCIEKIRVAEQKERDLRLYMRMDPSASESAPHSEACRCWACMRFHACRQLKAERDEAREKHKALLEVATLLFKALDDIAPSEYPGDHRFVRDCGCSVCVAFRRAEANADLSAALKQEEKDETRPKMDR